MVINHPRTPQFPQPYSRLEIGQDAGEVHEAQRCLTVHAPPVYARERPKLYV
jgi:hypothetical protein